MRIRTRRSRSASRASLQGNPFFDNSEANRFFNPVRPNQSLQNQSIIQAQPAEQKASSYMMLPPRPELTYDVLTKAWEDLIADYPKTDDFSLDCVKASNMIVERLSRQYGIKLPKATGHIVKRFYNIQYVRGNQDNNAIKRRNLGKKDKLGSTVTVYKGNRRRNIKSETVSLKPGMFVYTAEACYFGAKKKCGKWDERHMRMYVGNGEFRDYGQYGGSNTGRPVWGAAKKQKDRKLYIVLAVYDPFHHFRKLPVY